jgi:hypothetical protein
MLILRKIEKKNIKKRQKNPLEKKGIINQKINKLFNNKK